jgi:hypothetical protein
MSLRRVPECQYLDRKSLRKVTGSTSDFDELAQDCVCFANGAGGTVLIGIEDDADAPRASQRVERALLDRVRKRIGELTVNVQVAAQLKQHDNGGESSRFSATDLRPPARKQQSQRPAPQLPRLTMCRSSHRDRCRYSPMSSVPPPGQHPGGPGAEPPG